MYLPIYLFWLQGKSDHQYLAIIETYHTRKWCIDNNPPPIWEPKRGSKDLSLISASKYMDSWNRDYLTPSEPWSARTQASLSCQQFYSSIYRFRYRSLMEMATFVNVWGKSGDRARRKVSIREETVNFRQEPWLVAFYIELFWVGKLRCRLET